MSLSALERSETESEFTTDYFCLVNRQLWTNIRFNENYVIMASTFDGELDSGMKARTFTPLVVILGGNCDAESR